MKISAYYFYSNVNGNPYSSPCGSTKNSRCQAAFFVLHNDFMMIEYELHLLLVFF